ncbi:MAG: hypothetical protein L7U72_07580, partial [Rubripirellula sp.]|nr:hypothetical protein [Rubripirellula sp.]
MPRTCNAVINKDPLYLERVMLKRMRVLCAIVLVLAAIRSSPLDAAEAGQVDEATTGFVKTESRPNILFAISDDQSFPHASAYG